MKFENNWQQKSLEILENRKLKGGDFESFLVNRVLHLCKIQLCQFTIEDLRLMIGQNEGLIYCITLSIDILKKDVLAEGDFHPGDLLKNILNVEQEFWIENKILWK
jgi:hypothetical protein